MLIRRLSILLILAAPLVAQLSNNTVTVTASQNSTAQPDEAVFSVTVGSGIDKGLEDAVAAVSSFGITVANLVQVSSSASPSIYEPPPPSSLGWAFQLVVPFSKLKDTTATLTALQKSISQNSSGLSLSFALSGAQNSPPQARTCNLADLVSRARTQAQDIAGAAGYKAAVVGLTSAASNGASLCFLTVRFALGMMFGQPSPDITITATRTNSVQPDQVLIDLRVQSPATAGLDDMAGALTAVGIAGANFKQVYTTTIYTESGGVQTPEHVLVWSFSLTPPLSKISAALAQIISAQQAMSAKNSGLSLDFYVGGTQVSPQLQQSKSCPQAALVADAQAQAKQVAAAAGVSVGAILSTGDGGSGVASLELAPSFRLGDFTSVVGGAVGYPASISSVLTNPQPSCTITVQFQLL